MEAASKDDLFVVGECKDEKIIGDTPLKEGEGDGTDDSEALMAALKANSEWLQAKVAINNAMIAMDGTSRRNDFFSVGACEGQKIVDGELMPLVLTPSAGGEGGGGGGDRAGYQALVAALRANREWVEDKVVAHSAVLLRGFDVRDAAEFDAVVEALGWPDIRYVGPAPRSHVHGRVWTANEGPLDQFVYFHHEMVLIKDFPEKVILFCEVPPPEGGETPFVPSFRVTDRAAVGGVPGDGGGAGRQGAPLHAHGSEAIITRTCIWACKILFRYCSDTVDRVEFEIESGDGSSGENSLSKNDTKSMRGRGWEDAFGTSDKLEAEKR